MRSDGPVSPRQFGKRLHGYLTAADCEAHELRSLGWFDFLQFDSPDTADARIFAARAVFTLLVSGSGRVIEHDGRIVFAVLAFVRATRGGRLPTQVDRELNAILAKPPVEYGPIERWFLSTFP